MFRQMPVALAVNLVNAALVAIVLTPMTVQLWPFIWFGVVAAVTAGRGILWWRARRANTAADSRWWSIGATLGALLAGLSWGLGGALLFALVPPLAQLFVTIVIGGMCTGAVVLSATHLPTLLAFLLAACLPMAGRFVAAGTPADSVVGAMIMVYATAMAIAGRHLNRLFSETMRLRFELNLANRRLKAEAAERRAIEAALHQAQKLEAIGRLTGGIAHDFNNLLTIIIGNLVLASERLGDNSPVAPLLASAVRATDRGIALIQRLLGFARKQSLDPQPADLGRLIAGIRDMLRQTLGPQIGLVIDVPQNLTRAEIDTNQLELAILNLATNARDAMPAGGNWSIAITERSTDDASPPELAAGGYVVVELADTGIGMDEATLAQAFEPFFTTKRAGIGSGLGLATVQGFIAQSGGTVRLSSTLGAGTTVELWLPRAGAARPGAGADPSRSAQI